MRILHLSIQILDDKPPTEIQRALGKIDQCLPVNRNFW